jgi:glycerol uptake facilitator-like aquaporin
MKLKFLPLLIAVTALFLVPEIVYAQTTTSSSISSAASSILSAGNTYLRVFGILMFGGAGLCLIYVAYEAFQREWTKMLVGILVMAILGVAPYVVQAAASSWGLTLSGGILGGSSQ